MRGEGMAERVACGVLREAGLPYGGLYGSLEEGFIDMVAPLFARPRIDPAMLLGKYPLPSPVGMEATLSVWPLFIRSSVVMANGSSSSGSHQGEDSLGAPQGPPRQRK